jgi:hypothetical protein
MNELYPVIRRVRRPLLVTEAPPVVVGKVESSSGEMATPAPHPNPLPGGEGMAGDAGRSDGEPAGESGPVMGEREKRDEKTSSKRKAR